MSISDQSFETRSFPLKHLFVDQVVPALNKAGGRWEFGIYEPFTDPEHWLIQIRGVFASHECERKEVRVPFDWWEAVKQRFAPHWFLRKYPVRETVHVMEAAHVYPDYALGKLGRPELVLAFSTRNPADDFFEE